MLPVAGSQKFLNDPNLPGFFEADTRAATVSIYDLDTG